MTRAGVGESESFMGWWSKLHHPTRYILEICYGKESKIGQQTEAARGCKVYRITVSEDFTKPSGLNPAMEFLRKHGKDCLVWFSIPCTGGSTWQYVMKKNPKAYAPCYQGYIIIIKIYIRRESVTIICLLFILLKYLYILKS